MTDITPEAVRALVDEFNSFPSIPALAANATMADLAPSIARAYLALSERVRALTEALRPFAAACYDCIDPDEQSGSNTWEHPVGMNIDVGDFRRAEAALKVHSTSEQEGTGS